MVKPERRTRGDILAAAAIVVVVAVAAALIWWTSDARPPSAGRLRLRCPAPRRPGKSRAH
ncbi:hypothetical protein I546_4716 [Mycobacterium kansasii 732]|nr:hypothetical protein I546_4716 [Mycobacterium kansasii 732]